MSSISSNVHDKSPSLAELFAAAKKLKKQKFKSGSCIQLLFFAANDYLLP